MTRFQITMLLGNDIFKINLDLYPITVNGFNPRSFIYVSKHANIGNGTIIHHNVVVNASAGVGDLCIINTATVVEHDVTVGDFCHISTSTVINQGVIE